MGSHDLSTRDLPRLRRGAHKFLRGLAAHAWEHQNEFGRREITLPPDVAVLPEHQRFRVHAKQEAPRDPSHDRRTKEGTHAVTQIDFAYFNFEHGGLIGGEDRFYSSGRGCDFAGLVRVAGDQGRWPHILLMGEADRYGFAGGEGMWEAAAAMRTAGGRPYLPLLGSLPREWGPYAPVIFADAQSVVIRRWHDHRSPDFAARHRNLLVATLPGSGDDEMFRVVATHGDLFSGAMRLADAQALRRFADPAVPSLIAGDWNSVPSGPGWEDRELNDPRFWPPQAHWARAPRVLWQHGPAQAGPCVPDTQALDYLIGWWAGGQGCRVGGIGFFDVAELAQDFTPTQVPVPDGRQRRAIDRILVNAAWKDRPAPAPAGLLALPEAAPSAA